MTIFTDGFTIGKNPSLKGGGYAVVDDTGKLLYHAKLKKKGFTNNEGELRGIVRSLQFAHDGDTIITDSACSLAWIKRGYCKARPDLTPLVGIIQSFLRTKRVQILWQPRDENLAGQFNEGKRLVTKYKL